MLSGLPFGFEARAREESRCYSMTASDVIPLLARRSSLSYLTRSLLQPRGPGGAAAEADVASAEMTQQPARALIRREPVTCAADRALREVAQVMSDENVNSMIVRAENGELGIVTDSDIRSRVVAEGMSVDAPVGEVVSGPLTTVGADAAGADVMLEMLDKDVRHVGVLSPRGELLGVLGGIDLVAAEARTPFALRREIAQARDKEELSEAARAAALHGCRPACHQAPSPADRPGDLCRRRRAGPAHDRAGDRVQGQRRRRSSPGLRWAATADVRPCPLPTSTRGWPGWTSPSRSPADQTRNA